MRRLSPGTERTRPLLLVVIVAAGVATILASDDSAPSTATPVLGCAPSVSRSLFAATFDSDVVGGPPGPNGALAYGPPGSALDVAGAPGTAMIIDSPTLGSLALLLDRGNTMPTTVDAVAGEIDGLPNDDGILSVRYRAHGAAIPTDLIAGPTINVLSAADRAGVSLKLYDGSYHLLHAPSSSERLAGSYDPASAHDVEIVLDLTAERYTVCLDGTPVAFDREFETSGFGELDRVEFFMTQTVTEALPAQYVLDEIRILK